MDYKLYWSEEAISNLENSPIHKATVMKYLTVQNLRYEDDTFVLQNAEHRNGLREFWEEATAFQHLILRLVTIL